MMYSMKGKLKKLSSMEALKRANNDSVRFGIQYRHGMEGGKVQRNSFTNFAITGWN